MAEDLKTRIRADLDSARRERDRFRTTLLTTVLSDIRNREIDQKRDAGDADVVDVLATAIKRRQEAAEQMRAGNRVELADKEEREATLLSSYLPPALTEADVRALVREAVAAGATNVGAVTGQLMPRIKGRFDGREANRIVREELG
jgi:uncharacterized protein